VRDGIHPSDLVRGKGVSPSTPRDGHLARHRPVAGVLLDELLSGHEVFSKTLRRSCPDASHRWLAHDMRMAMVEKPNASFFETTRDNARDMRA
jgi:hypothetical protein